MYNVIRYIIRTRRECTNSRPSLDRERQIIFSSLDSTEDGPSTTDGT